MVSDTADTARSRALPRGKQVKHRGGRPTKEAAAERDERLLEIATRMFMEQGFDATSMDSLAEAAAIGKATLYARYADKATLFAAVLRLRIMQIYVPLEEEFKGAMHGDDDLGTTLRSVAWKLLDHSLSPDALELTRILSAQSARFPELGQLAVREGFLRQVALIKTILERFVGTSICRIDDLDLAADLFLSIVLGRSARTALLGASFEREYLEQRIDAAVAIFLGGFIRG